VSFEVTVHGARELAAAFLYVEGRVDPILGKALTAAAEPVKSDARRRASGYSARTASGIRVRRKGTAVRVEQGMKKTTGFHSSYGGFQQRNFFDPALDDNRDEVEALARAAMDEIVDRVNEAH
jgi:hypothetical protein